MNVIGVCIITNSSIWLVR